MELKIGDKVKICTICDVDEDGMGVCPEGVSLSSECYAKIGIIQRIDYMNYVRYKVVFSSKPKDYCFFSKNEMKLVEEWSVS